MQRKSIYTVIAISFLVAVALIQFYFTRNYFLDDTFIHLRIAENFIDTGEFVFNKNQVSSSYPTSSPFYTTLLYILLSFYDSPYITKIANIAAYCMIFYWFVRLIDHTLSSMQKVLLLFWLSAIVSPMGIRWLFNGMETTFIALGSILLGQIIANSTQRVMIYKGIKYDCLILLLGAFLVSLRIEFLYVILLAISPILWTNYRSPNKLGNENFKRVAFLIFGSLLSILLIWLTFGEILGDPSIAKSEQFGDIDNIGQQILYSFKGILIAHAGASYFSMVSALCLLITSFLCFRQKKIRKFIVFYLLGFGFFLFLIIFRQQAIHGYRNFIFIEFFILSYNFQTLTNININLSKEFKRFTQKSRDVFTIIAVIVILFATVHDLRKMIAMNNSGSETYLNFSNLDLTDLKGTVGIAWDAGFIGYYSKEAHLLDPNGLINGRDFAQLSVSKRFKYICEQKEIKFVYVNQSQMDQLKNCYNFEGWQQRSTFDFQNFSEKLTYFLLVKNDLN